MIIWMFMIYLVCISSLHFIHSLFDLFSYNKVALRTSNPFKGNQEEGVQNPSRGIRLLVLFWEIVASYIHLSLKRSLILHIFYYHGHIDCWPVLCFMFWLLAWMLAFIKTRIYTCTTSELQIDLYICLYLNAHLYSFDVLV